MCCKNTYVTGSVPFRAAFPEASRSVDSNAMSDEELRAAFMKGYQEANKKSSEDFEGFALKALHYQLKPYE